MNGAGQRAFDRTLRDDVPSVFRQSPEDRGSQRLTTPGSARAAAPDQLHRPHQWVDDATGRFSASDTTARATATAAG